MGSLNEKSTAMPAASPDSPNNARAQMAGTGRVIKETEFMANEDRRLQQLANLIQFCGKTPLEIANACGLDKRTVLRALKGLPLKSDAQARIEYYIREKLNYGNKAKTPEQEREGQG